MEISRPQISRLLKRAQELGIVTINVALPNSIETTKLEKKLKKLLELDSVSIAPDMSNDEKNFYSFCAGIVQEFIKGKKHIGIGWGQSVYETSTKLSHIDLVKKGTFYSLIGSAGQNNPYFQTNSITDRFVEKMNGNALYINNTVFKLQEELSEEEMQSLLETKKRWDNLDSAIIGIGGEHVPSRKSFEELDNNVIFQEKSNQVIGEIIANFFLEDNTVLEFANEYSIVACSLKQLEKTPNVIAIAKGEDKVKSIHFAATNQYINRLVTDRATAMQIIDRFEQTEEVGHN